MTTTSPTTVWISPEVSSVLEMLRIAISEKDEGKMEYVLERILSIIALGIDVSPLYGEMVKALSTSSLAQKKIVYLYLYRYASLQPDLALLLVNTFRKDCTDENPAIRGLALRSMSNLRISNIVEYVLPFIGSGLVDVSSFVRKIAVIACAKLNEVSPNLVRENLFQEKLIRMLEDQDTAIAVNCLRSLELLLNKEEKETWLSDQVMFGFLNKITDFDEWGQCCLLNLLQSHFVQHFPSSESLLFNILNILDPLLNSINCAVLVSTCNIFLFFAERNQVLKPHICKRLKAPLLSLALSSVAEVAFMVLQYIQTLLTMKSPVSPLFEQEIFSDCFSFFFCRVSDPNYVNLLKVNILTLIVNDTNVNDIVSELSEYAKDFSNSELSCRSVQAIGKISLRSRKIFEGCCHEKLLEFLELSDSHPISVTLVILKDILKIYPEKSNEYLLRVKTYYQYIHEENTDAKSALVWMLGEFGERFEDVPYILESIVNSIISRDARKNFFNPDEHQLIMHQILNSCIKLFLKRPKELKTLLVTISRHIFEQKDHESSCSCFDNSSLQERAKFLISIVKNNPKQALSILGMTEDMRPACSDNTPWTLARRPQDKSIKEEFPLNIE